MGFINLAERTVHAKLVYYGIGSGGKTTSLQSVHGIMCPSNDVKLVSINTEEDATLLFDFLPIDIGTVEGFKIVIQGFTVPGQPKYKRMRKYVLQGADAVVLVVDSQRSRLEENLEALEGLIENLKSNGLDPETIPIFVQYNKRDLEDIMSEEEMDPHFLFRDDVRAFPSVATEDQGVYETFVHCASVLVERKIEQYNLGQGSVKPSDVADSAREKLWSIFDDFRHLQEEAQKSQVLDLTVDEPEDSEEVSQAEVDPEDVPKEGEIFSDDDLDFEFGDVSFDEDAPTEEERQTTAEEGLLDKALQSNLDLASAYGDLDRYKAGLQRKNEELIKFTQNSVHDLRKPLCAVKLMMQSALKGYLGEVNDKLTSGIDNGLMAVRLMERLIEDLSDSLKFDTCFKMEFVEVDMSLLVGDVVNTLRYLVDEHNVGVRVEPLPTIQADQWALTKAFVNLMGNAIQYGSSDRPARVNVWYQDQGEYHKFCVADNGIGIPEGQTEKLFQRFERGSNVAGISGTGLGLHIVKETVMGHGGFVKVESVEGEGSVFQLFIAKAPVAVPQTDIVEAPPTASSV